MSMMGSVATTMDAIFSRKGAVSSSSAAMPFCISLMLDSNSNSRSTSCRGHLVRLVI